MSKRGDIKEFLKAYESAIDRKRGQASLAEEWNALAVEKALLCALRAFESNLPELDGRFHKSFRQMDCCGVPYMDSCIWNLLDSGVDIFWSVFGRFSMGGEDEGNDEPVADAPLPPDSEVIESYLNKPCPSCGMTIRQGGCRCSVVEGVVMPDDDLDGVELGQPATCGLEECESCT